MAEQIKSVLTIAGSDSSGGAGIQADIKTIAAMKMFAQSAITALTAQNTTGVYGVVDVAPEFVEQQIDVVFDDIRPDAVKIGMVSKPETVVAIKDALVRNNARNIVVDPVMVATSGAKLIDDSAISALVNDLFSIATVITPNLFEAEILADMKIACVDDMKQAAQKIAVTDRAIRDAQGISGAISVLIKGGHFAEDEKSANDFLLCADGSEYVIEGERISCTNTHGTGCTLSSAIACGLAANLLLPQACQQAKNYIQGALKNDMDLGRGSGPLNHNWVYI